MEEPLFYCCYQSFQKADLIILSDMRKKKYLELEDFDKLFYRLSARMRSGIKNNFESKENYVKGNFGMLL